MKKGKMLVGKKKDETNKYENKEKMLVKIKIALWHNTKKGKSDRCKDFDL